MKQVHIEWLTDKNEHYFAYYLDFVKENSHSIYATGIYGDIYKIEKASKKVYINTNFVGIATKYNVF